MRDTQAKAASHLCEVAKKSAEIHRLRSELRKSHIVILRFQARELMRRSMMRTIIKLLVYLHARAQRRGGPEPAERGFPEIRKSKLGTASA